jgi:hypothetical protein
MKLPRAHAPTPRNIAHPATTYGHTQPHIAQDKHGVVAYIAVVFRALAEPSVTLKAARTEGGPIIIASLSS